MVIQFHSEGKSLREIGCILTKPFSTIGCIITKFKNIEQLNNLLRSSRDKNFMKEIKKNPLRSAPQSAVTLYNVTRKRVHRDTIKHGRGYMDIKPVLPEKKPFLPKVR